MPYMVTFTINIPQMLAYIPSMDPMELQLLRANGSLKAIDFMDVPYFQAKPRRFVSRVPQFQAVSSCFHEINKYIYIYKFKV